MMDGWPSCILNCAGTQRKNFYKYFSLCSISASISFSLSFNLSQPGSRLISPLIRPTWKNHIISLSLWALITQDQGDKRALGERVCVCSRGGWRRQCVMKLRQMLSVLLQHTGSPLSLGDKPFVSYNLHILFLLPPCCTFYKPNWKALTTMRSLTCGWISSTCEGVAKLAHLKTQ